MSIEGLYNLYFKCLLIILNCVRISAYLLQKLCLLGVGAKLSPPNFFVCLQRFQRALT